MIDVARRQGSVSPHRGRWRVRYTAGGEQKSGGVYESREEAEDVLAALLGELGGSPTRTVRGWGEQWLDRRETIGLHRDVAADRSRWKYVTAQPWADEPLDALTAKTIKAWVLELVQRKLARQTICNALNLLRVCLRDAVEAEAIPSNPAADVRVPKMARTDDPWTWLKPHEVETLIGHEKLPPYQRAVFTAAIYTGAREGELFALRWRDVDLDGARLILRASWRKPRKNGKVLSVPLLPAAVEALRTWRRERPALPAALVFPGDDGAPHVKGYDAQWASRWKAATGTRDDVRFHDFRHTCAASLVSGAWGRAWSLEEVKELLGHSSIKVTERYAHFAPEALHAAAAATPGLKTRAKTQDTGR
jgi:integrase